jgi:uncharacterized protein (DUF1800 family)
MATRFAGILGAACLLVWLSALRASGAEPVSDGQIIHVLNRLAFGPTLEELRHVRTIGVDRYIAEQLDPESIEEPIELRWRLGQLDTLLNQFSCGSSMGRCTCAVSSLLRSWRRRSRNACGSSSMRPRHSQSGIEPTPAAGGHSRFRFNHFNVFSGKGLDDVWIGNYEQQAIRPFALGRFRDLLFATTKHPAMLVYLDNTLSTAPGSPGARGNRAGLNENFAREVMELHTLGADGGYTQEDVITLARILTGWGVNPPDARDYPEHAAVFEGRRHDYSPKVFLGRTLNSSGKAEGEEALDILARSPATAHHISYELAQYFVSDDPPPALVDRLAKRFQETDGSIREILKALFASREFWDSYGRKYKTPYHFVISAARAAGVAIGNVRPLLGMMDQLGMPVFGCLTPDGYKNTEDAWLSPDATTRRVSFATAFARGGLPVSGASRASVDPPAKARMVDAAHLTAIFGSTMTGPTREAIAQAPPALHAALILGGPDFMRR